MFFRFIAAGVCTPQGVLYVFFYKISDRETLAYLLTFSLQRPGDMLVAIIMAVATYSPGIEYVQGALAKAKKQAGHRHGDYLIGTHRTAPTQNPNCTRLYVRKGTSYDRTTQPSSDELNARERFKTVAGMVKARKEDLTKISQDLQAFLAQKDTAGGKKTMKAYLWKVCGEEYDAQH